ncbi:PAS domain S-box protein [Candidatus Gracilibacteria bacterium]|nr:PAS domain S-box protein [Candidatus Gracilibacteria bacterium]NUJ98390.1 PAS domain S-box protein [Candidatus Gracilibacteria bacterium]
MYSWQNSVKSKLLKKQISKYLNFLEKEEYEKLNPFLNAIDEEYTYENERLSLVEKTLEVSSSELTTKNEQLSNILNKNIEINEKLQESKDNLASIIDNLGEGLIVVDSNNTIVIINSKASLLTGYSKEFLKGKNYNEYINFVSDNEKIKIGNFILDTLKEGKEYFFNKNILLIGKNKNIPISLISTPLENFSSGKRSCIIVFRDATKERELENMKNEFISVTSHELRTPMTVIKEYVNLFLKGKFGPINETQKKYGERVLSNTDTLIELVNDTLDINKIESGKMDYEFTSTNIRELIVKTIEEFTNLLSEKNIIIEHNLGDITAMVDEEKLKQVLINLISNAYKFTNFDGKIIIKLEEMSDKRNFQVSIEDTGIGIRRKDINKLFKKFSQIGSHLNKTEKGTGLGLFICKNIIEGMGGKIFIKSSYGKGSTFSFILPIKQG